MFRDKVGVKVAVVGVGKSTHDAINFMKAKNTCGVDYYSVPAVSHLMVEPDLIRKWYDETLSNLDLLLIVSDLESDEVLCDVLGIADLSKKNGVLTLLVNAEDDEQRGQEALMKPRLDEVSKLVASTVIIKAQQLSFFKKVKGSSSILDFRNEAYCHVLFALTSPLIGKGYILVDLVYYYDLFAPQGSKWGNTCLFGVGEASGGDRAKLAVGKAMEMLSLNQLDVDSVSGFLTVVAASEETLEMKEYEEVTNVIHNKASDDQDIITSMLFTKELGSSLLCFVVACCSH